MNETYNYHNNDTNYPDMPYQQPTGQNPYQSTNSPKKANSFLKRVGILALSGVIIGTTAGGAFVGSTYLLQKNKKATSITNVQSTSKQNSNTQTATLTTVGTHNTTSTKDAGTVASIVANCMPSIVAITNVSTRDVYTFWGTQQAQSKSCGSGVIIGQTDKELLIVTNQHVIDSSNNLTILFSFDESNDQPSAVEAYVKGYDTDKDLAVIAVAKENLTKEMLDQLSVASIGSSKDLVLGEQVVAIGNALGYGQSVTTGIVSALDRSISSSESPAQTTTADTNKYIQTDAAINPGNSGGALFNMKGELVGINSAKIASNGVEGMGYAIPITDVYDLIQNLMNQTTRTETVTKNNRGYLGISGTDVTAEISSTYGLPRGIYVSDVTEGSAAEKAGITTGYIITGFDGKTVKSISELQTLLTYYKANETVDVTVSVLSSSKYEEKTISVTLSSAKDVNADTTESEATEQPTQNVPNFFSPFSNDSRNSFSFGN